MAGRNHNSDGASSPYLQFPLCLLAHLDNPVDRLQSIVSYSVTTTGAKLREKLSADDESEIVERVIGRQPGAGISKKVQQHRDIAIGADRLGITIGRIAATVERYASAVWFVSNMRAEFGDWPHTRVRNAYLWEVHNGAGMSYRHFAVLCAVYSIIGEKSSPVRITRDRIIAGALGYKSPKMLLGEAGARLLAQRTDGAKPMSVDQVRYTLDTLEAQGHFARVAASKRQTYFSHRIPRDEMVKKLADWKTKRRFTLDLHRNQDRELRQKISSVNNPEPKQDSPPIPHFNSEQASETEAQNCPHAFPTEPPLIPHSVPTGLPTIIETLSEKLPSEKHPLEKHSLCVELEAEEQKAEPKPEPRALLPESITEVEAFFEGLKKGTGDYAAEYWELITAKPRKGEWKTHAASWILDSRRKRGKAA